MFWWNIPDFTWSITILISIIKNYTLIQLLEDQKQQDYIPYSKSYDDDLLKSKQDHFHLIQFLLLVFSITIKFTNYNKSIHESHHLQHQSLKMKNQMDQKQMKIQHTYSNKYIMKNLLMTIQTRNFMCKSFWTINRTNIQLTSRTINW